MFNIFKKETKPEDAFAKALEIGNIEDINLTKEGEDTILADLAGIDGILDYLRDTMSKDIKRYFAAQTEKERDIIRGAFARVAYLRAEIVKLKT